MTSRGGADTAPGHLRQFIAALTMHWSVDRPGSPDICLSKDQPHGWVETVGAGGRKSQKAPAIWLGGVSAVISASDLDGPTFPLVGQLWHRSKLALPSEGKSPKVRTACQARQLEVVDLCVLEISKGGGHCAPVELIENWCPLTRDGCHVL